jgi:hypothetical protein
MKKNSITNKITPCCGLPFSVMYWWVSNLTLNSESDRQYLLTQISQNGVLSIDGWKVLINSGTLEVDASLTKAEFLAWLDCGRQPSCEQLKLIIESFQVGSWNAFYTDLHELNLAFDELVSEVGLKYNNQEETKAQDVFRLINEASGVIHTYRKATKAFNDVNITDNLVSLFPTIFRKKGDDFYRIQDENGFNIKMFGAVGDKVTDDSNAIQNAVLFCEFFQIKTLRVPTGNYLINSKVIFNRGGVRIVGEGALSREESWIGFATEEYPENFPLGISETYHGCTFTIPKNSVGFEFSKSVVDNVYFSDVQFLAINKNDFV